MVRTALRNENVLTIIQNAIEDLKYNFKKSPTEVNPRRNNGRDGAKDGKKWREKS